MSNKSRLRKARCEEREEKQAKLVVRWIAAALLALGLLYIVVSMLQ